jgi:hypothetical protein
MKHFNLKGSKFTAKRSPSKVRNNIFDATILAFLLIDELPQLDESVFELLFVINGAR